MSSSKLRPIEVMLIVVGLGISGAWFVSTAHTNCYKSLPTVCQSNLRSISQALYIYAQEGDVFPMSTDGSHTGEMGLFQNRDRPPLRDGPPSPTADMWMTVRQGNTTAKMFICPFTVDVFDPADNPTTYFDFADRKHLSYSYVYQYHPQRGPVGTNSEPWVPLLADSNPYVRGGIQDSATNDRASAGKGNSTNHPARDGQNVAFVDGHVSFIRTPLVPDSVTFPRANKSMIPDNIYTTHADNEPADPGNAPTWTRIQIGSKSDYCLVP